MLLFFFCDGRRCLGGSLVINYVEFCLTLLMYVSRFLKIIHETCESEIARASFKFTSRRV